MARPPLLLALFAAAAAGPVEEPLQSAALAEDGECDAGDESCALNAVQLRGQRIEGERAEATAAAEDRSTWGSCGQYQCSMRFHKWQHCQCNPGCVNHKDCCWDFKEVCGQGHDNGAGVAPAHGALAGAHVYGHPSSTTEYPTYPGFTLTLVEEFDSFIDLDADPIWTWSDGGLSEGQVRFQKQNIRFEDGKMKIIANNVPALDPQTCSHAEVAEIGHKPLSSGEMRTRYNMFRYGRYEVRMKAPNVQPGNSRVDGNYIATMFVFRDAKYKHWREIDFELKGDSPGAVTTNVLSADNTDRWKAGIQESRDVGTANARSEFHTYAFEWLPDSITWYIDGEKVREKRGGSVPVPNMSAKIMMNMWIFGPSFAFGGRQGYNNVYPLVAEYDWFRFYKWDGEKQYPCPAMGTGCLSSDDQYLSSNNPCDGIEQIGTVYGKQPCHASCQ